MTSFVSRIVSLFGGSRPSEPVASQESREAYQDVELVAQPMKEGSQYRIAGRIEK